MPRFFFHFRDQNGFKQDEEGQVFPDLQAAHTEALKSAQELWSDLPPDMAREAISIEIADETGETVLTVPFMEAANRLAEGTAEPHHKGSGAD
jgi:hypothetical protein